MTGHLTLFLRQLTCLGLLQLGDAGHALGTEQTTAPVTTDLVGTVVVVGLDGLDQFGEVGAIASIDAGQRDRRAGLATHQGAQASLALDDAVRDAHFAAQGRQEQDHLQWVDVVRDDDQLGLLLFDQLGDGVDAGAHKVRLLLWLDLFAAGLGLGDLLQAVLLGQFRLWPVLFQQFEQLNGVLLVQRLAELVDWWWDLQARLQHNALALDANVFGPTDEAGQVTFWLDVLAWNGVQKMWL